MRLRLVFIIFLLALPLRLHAQPVEEPDTDIPESGPSETGIEQPKNTPAPETLPPPAPDKAAKKKSGDKDKTAQKPSAPAKQIPFNAVVLQGLNKITARTETIDAPIGGVVRFGTIEIIAHRCWQSAPEEQPENAALLEISEVRQNEPPRQIFLGWMYSSSPALSSLEHPFYDVTVVKCEHKSLKE